MRSKDELVVKRGKWHPELKEKIFYIWKDESSTLLGDGSLGIKGWLQQLAQLLISRLFCVSLLYNFMVS